MRDAQVNPEAGDFLEPVGTISPGIHANQGIHPVTPGPVSATPATQEAAEKAAMADFQPVTTFAVTPATATVTVVAPTSQLTATATMVDTVATNVSTTTTWTTSDAGKATVSAAGLVTRVANGSATITGAYRGKTDTTVVTVTA